MISTYAHKNKYSIYNRFNLEKVKSGFVTKVYLHLLGSIFFLVLLEIIFFRVGIAEIINNVFSSIPWLAILGGFMIIAWIAREAAYKIESLLFQYLGLILYIIAKSIILIPLLYHSEKIAPGSIFYAAQITISGFLILTMIVFFTKKDFSFLRTFLIYAGIISLVIIILALIFSISLGVWFDIALILIGGGSILYDTSNVIHRYNSNKYVGASLELFSSIALIFWYSLRLLRRIKS